MEKHSGAIRFLTSLLSLRGVDAATVRKLASRCRTVSLRPAQGIFTEGDPCNHLYILAAGRGKCYRAPPPGGGQNLKIFWRTGGIFCTTAAFRPAPPLFPAGGPPAPPFFWLCAGRAD